MSLFPESRFEVCPKHGVCQHYVVTECAQCAQERSKQSHPQAAGEKPTVVCLCGSTRFSDTFREANFQETLAGRIVLSIGCDFKSDAALGLTEADKVRLDELHKRKIDLADEVLILNVGGYIGDSTRSELEYAKAHGKWIRYWERHQ